MPTWTRRDIPSLEGKLAIVTGANSGLGLETARGLAGAGAEVILACRAREKAEAAIAELTRDGIDAARLRFLPLDLASLDSIREFADSVLAEHEHLDVLINNAGVMALPYRTTADGFEMQIGTNHLGHFALTGRLLPALLRREGARVISLASLAHKGGKIDFDDLHSRRSYNKWRAYCQSKLANLLHSFELGRRLEQGGHSLIAAAAHPGYAATNLQIAGPKMAGRSWARRVFEIGNSIMAQDAASGALPTLYAATASEVRSGDYFGPGGAFEIMGPPVRVRATSRAYDRDAARRLWELSVELTGVEIPELA